MRRYLVTFIDLEGYKHKELFEATDAAILTQLLEAQSLILLKIQKSNFLEAFYYSLTLKKITDSEIVEVMHTLHFMVKSGVPLHQALEDLALESDNLRLKRVLLAIAHAVSGGSSLSDAMQVYNKLFAPSTIHLIRIGEKSGILEATLLKAKSFLEKRIMLKRAMTSALIYPSLVFIVALAAILVWFVFVMPQLQMMFTQMDIPLPWLTKFLIYVGDIVAASYLYVLSFVILFFWLVNYLYKKNVRMREKLMTFFMQLPLIGIVIRYYNMAYISEYLHLSLESGVTIFKAIQTMSDNISNPLYKKSMKRVISYLEQGESFSKALQREELYSSFVIRMLHSGEKSGDLETQLYTIAHFYYEKLNAYTQNISKIIEPSLIIFVGGFFALIMLGLMGPIFNLMAYAQ